MVPVSCLISSQESTQPASPAIADQEIAFLFARTSRDINLKWLHDHPKLLNYLVAAVTRQPKNLLVHMQRIYLCYEQDLQEQLYGALADLFIVLNRSAIAFSSRLLSAVSTRISDQHFTLLRRYLLKKDFPPHFLPPSPYMVLGKGLIGTLKLVTKLKENSNNATNHDPLLLARDHLEYSQFNEAKEVLEQAILENPEREELHDDLLELYISLKDAEGFHKFQHKLAELKNPFVDKWYERRNFFNKK
jgi:tetratricopeptide (TPR) repeat protein